MSPVSILENAKGTHVENLHRYSVSGHARVYNQAGAREVYNGDMSGTINKNDYMPHGPREAQPSQTQTPSHDRNSAGRESRSSSRPAPTPAQAYPTPQNSFNPALEDEECGMMQPNSVSGDARVYNQPCAQDIYNGNISGTITRNSYMPDDLRAPQTFQGQRSPHETSELHFPSEKLQYSLISAVDPIDTAGRESRSPSRPAPAPAQAYPTPQSSFNPAAEEDDSMYCDETNTASSPTMAFAEKTPTKQPQVPPSPFTPTALKRASARGSEVESFTPQLRHTVIVANDAKTDLESKIDDVATFLDGAGIRRHQWVAQVGFDQESLSRGERSFEYQQEIVITVLDSSTKARALRMDRFRSLLPSYNITVRLPGGEILKTNASVPASQVVEQRERRRGVNVENQALGGEAGRRLYPSATAPGANPCIEISTFDNLSSDDPAVGVATNFGFDITKTGNESSIKFHKISFAMPSTANAPFHIQYGRVRVTDDGKTAHRAIRYPEIQPSHGDDFKVTTAHKTLSSVIKKFAAKVSGRTGGELGAEYGTTRGSEDEARDERTRRFTAISHEDVPGGWRLDYDTSELPRTSFQPPRKFDDGASHATVADFSLGYTGEGEQEKMVTVKLTSLWALPVDAYQVPKEAKLLKKMWKGKGKARDAASMMAFTNFVHVVEVTFPSDFSGTIPDDEPPSSPFVVDLTRPALRAGQ
ncbi:hypothetical protein MD484_g5474, partial [Candolleomyces efflorescens]